jgi:hypothetical protein
MTTKTTDIQPQVEVETMFVLTGHWIDNWKWLAKGRFPNDGTPVSVSFDQHYNDVIKRHIKENDVIGFYHTHPSFPGEPSSIDISTMNTWVDVLGKPLLCLIDGADGLRTYYWYDENQYIDVGNSYKYENIFTGEFE